MNEKFVKRIAAELEEIREAGLYKTERIITTPQGAEIEVTGARKVTKCLIFAQIIISDFLLTRQ
jgi:glycine C-acetyltransferase